MNRLDKINQLRKHLGSGGETVGSWMQIPHPSIAEIMGNAGYDWVAVDLEHGAIGHHQLPDLFRALELGGTLPLARLAQGEAKDCKQALDAGAGGVIVPMVESADHLTAVRDVCRWPPAGTRGVGFSRANLFGARFETYRQEAQSPLLIAQIEHIKAVEALPDILRVDGLDGILVGPYDLSASMGITGEFHHPAFLQVMASVLKCCQATKVAAGVHIVNPDQTELESKLHEGYRLIAFGIDAVFLAENSRRAKI